MNDQAITTEQPDGTTLASRDIGTTFIELLVSIVLLGTIVIAVLVSLQVSTTASVVDSNQARANAYLHDASDAVYEAQRVSCTSGAAAVASAYQTAVTPVPPPEGWAGITVQVTNVQFLTSPDPNSNVFTWGSDCREGVTPVGDYTDFPLLSQKVTLEVTSPNGNLTKVLETVKADG